MSFILIITIVFFVVATFWSIVLLYQLRDWRMSILTLTLALMSYAQLSILLNDFQGWPLSFVIHVSEISVFLVSVLSIFLVALFNGVIKEYLGTEEELKSSQRLLQSVLDTIPVRVFWKDRDSKFLGCNSLYLKDAGINSQKDILGKDDNDLPWKERTEFYRADDLEVMESDIAKINYEELLISTIGDEHWLRTSKIPLKNTQGEVFGVLGTYEDITEEKNRDKDLRFTKFAIDNLTVAAFWIRQDGQLIYVNDAACESMGYSKDELLDMYVWELGRSSRFTEENWAEYWISTRENYSDAFETVHEHRNGKIFPVEISTNHLEYEGIEYRCTFVRDISERKESEELIQASEERYRTLYDNNPTMFFTIDSELNVLSVNNFGAEQLGYVVEELIGNIVLDVFVLEDKHKASEYLKNCLAKPDDLHRWELRKKRKDGVILWVRETARVVQDFNNEPCILVVCEDITEVHILSEQLSYQASHDALTGLINRREFEVRLKRIIETTRENMSEHVLCYLDLDQFKVINDTCGHFAGDDLLNQISQVINKRIRKRDTLARLGGDEFGILMEHCNIDQAQKVANSILKEVKEFRFLWEDKKFTIGVSMGMVLIDEFITDHTDVLRKVDAACYAAKDAGRNRIHIYSEDDINLARRHGEMQWLNRIDKALEQDSFVLYMQPIISVGEKNDDIFQYEILLRLKEGEGKELILPGAFLPAVERYDMAAKVDKWVINALFQFFEDNPDALSRFEYCAVNLSGQTLADYDFLDFVMGKLKDNRDVAKKICFEVTETAAISNLHVAARFMKSLKELGCYFSLDDFGSGLSSFAYLKTLPVDYLKIDGFFVKNIVESETDYAMVKSINEICQVMGIETIAEFVETKEIKQKLTDINVNYIQGYDIGKPEPLENLLK